MTDEMRAYEKAICEVAKVSDIGEVSDGFHTFNGLYEQRMILLADVLKCRPMDLIVIKEADRHKQEGKNI